MGRMPKTPPERPAPSASVDQDLIDSWVLHLRAERRSRHTINSYRDGLRAYRRWCQATKKPTIILRGQVVAFLADIVTSGRSAMTAQARHAAVTRFCAWQLAEGIIADNPLAGLKTPKADDPVIDPLSGDEIKAMIKACEGPSLMARRDEAIIRFMVENPTRATEVAEMRLSDTSVKAGTAILRGKGGKQRIVGISPQTARAIDRYLRLRRGHRLADTDQLWLGANGHTFGYAGLYFALGRRAAAAGIEDFHPHRLRHTSADRWLDAGGSEGGLMAVAGWESYAMLRRYTKRRSNIRAIAESQRLNLGDL